MRYGLLSRCSKAAHHCWSPGDNTLNDRQTKCVIDTVAQQRNCKPIANQHLQAMLIACISSREKKGSSVYSIANSHGPDPGHVLAPDIYLLIGIESIQYLGLIGHVKGATSIEHSL